MVEGCFGLAFPQVAALANTVTNEAGEYRPATSAAKAGSSAKVIVLYKRKRGEMILKWNSQSLWYINKWRYASKSSWRHGSAQIWRLQVFW